MALDFFPAFADTCSIATVTRDEWSDYSVASSTSVSCHFRRITNIRTVSHGEERDADAMVWFPAATSVDIGSIVLFDGLSYQVERLTKAHRLGESTVQFIKCDLKITDSIS